MKELGPIYSYASNTIELLLRDHSGVPFSLSGSDRVFLLAKRFLESQDLLFNVEGFVVDRPSSRVVFNIPHTDTTHTAGRIVLECRVSDGSIERVVEQFESEIAQSLSSPSFCNYDFSPRYATHVVITEDCLFDLPDYSFLDVYDSIVVDAESFYYLPDYYKQKAIVKFDFWSSRYYELQLDQQYPEIISYPSDYSMPAVQNQYGRYVYRMNDLWLLMFYLDVVSFLSTYGNTVKGILLDNCWSDMGDAWLLSNGDDLLVWQDRTDSGGDLVVDWNRSRLLQLETLVTNLLSSTYPSCGLLVAGDCWVLPTTSRFAENASLDGPSWHKELVARLEDSGSSYPYQYAKNGDFIQVNCYDSTGAFSQFVVNEYGSGLEAFVRMSHTCYARGCSLGVAYAQDPISGNSRYSLMADPRNPRWYNY